MLDTGNVIITSHVIVYDNVSEHGHAFRLPYQRVVSVETVSKGIFSRTYKTILRLKPPQWSCTACTLLNNSTLLKCQACGTNRFEDVHVCYDPIDIKITLKAGDTRRITVQSKTPWGKRFLRSNLLITKTHIWGAGRILPLSKSQNFLPVALVSQAYSVCKS